MFCRNFCGDLLHVCLCLWPDSVCGGEAKPRAAAEGHVPAVLWRLRGRAAGAGSGDRGCCHHAPQHLFAFSTGQGWQCVFIWADKVVKRYLGLKLKIFFPGVGLERSTNLFVSSLHSLVKSIARTRRKWKRPTSTSLSSRPSLSSSHSSSTFLLSPSSPKRFTRKRTMKW